MLYLQQDISCECRVLSSMRMMISAVNHDDDDQKEGEAEE